MVWYFFLFGKCKANGLVNVPFWSIFGDFEHHFWTSLSSICWRLYLYLGDVQLGHLPTPAFEMWIPPVLFAIRCRAGDVWGTPGYLWCTMHLGNLHLTGGIVLNREMASLANKQGSHWMAVPIFIFPRFLLLFCRLIWCPFGYSPELSEVSKP